MTPGEDVCGCEPGDAAAGGGGGRGGGGPGAGEHGHEDQEVQVQTQHGHHHICYMTSYFAVHKTTRPQVQWWEEVYWKERSFLLGEFVYIKIDVSKLTATIRTTSLHSA